ncbi:hypothetical protein GCM10022223_46570 [Kineosporia mesophila]|uniref:Two-component system sensor histidine kinase DesK n=1 Tax=Kineosporia mesophila TaxID=566012 RepID=A0ABP7A3J2_9ACTN|nr:histidine kinase [Kineosporia mesophila]MCD5353768.1 histidine kinase [Kineosporia mesophila]
MSTETTAPVMFGRLRVGRWVFSPSWLLSGVWLFFLSETFGAALDLESLVQRVVAIAVLLVFCALYIYAFQMARSRRWVGEEVGPVRFLTVLVLAVALTLSLCLLVGEYGLTLAVYDAVMAIMLMRPGWALASVVGLVVGVETATRTVPGWVQQDGLAFSILLSSVAVWGISQMVARNIQLAQAQQQIARLAVARERDRFARDLHDLLGHSLTVITMKSELAGRLVSLDAGRAEQEIADVERLARDALADVRAAVSGYREVTLPSELVSARIALDAAGIVAELPSAVDEVPGDRRELFGWAVREGVTNVVRHSGAGHCRVTLSRTCVEIVDDGHGPGSVDAVVVGSGDESVDASGHGPGNGMGNGLRGLRERAEAVGASVSVGRGDEGRGFRLRVGS